MPMRTSFHRREIAGLTLIELLLALFISTIAAVAVFSLFLGQSRGMRQSQESMEIHDNVRVALDVMARDLRSAGFMTQDNGSLGYALRVENNCGASATGQVGLPAPDANGVEWTGTALVVPSATDNAIEDNGNLPQTNQNDGCPNGSDRFSATYRSSTQYLQFNGANAGCNPKLRFDCEPFGTCQNALTSQGIQGVCSGGPPANSAPTLWCASNDPYRCFMVYFAEDSGGCPCGGGIGVECALDVFEMNGTPFNSNPTWNAMCPDPAGGCGCPTAKTNSAVGAWVTRSYQLMDLDGNGTTELVTSQDQAGYATRADGPFDATFDVVANNIDDLQVAVAYRSAPDTFVSKNLWNFQNCTPGAQDDCLFPRVTAGPGLNDPPIAVRVTVVARSQKRRISEVGSGQVDRSYRSQVEDNDPPQDPYTPGTIPTGGAYCYNGATSCGCGTAATLPAYMKCSMRGNAEGFARRVVTEVISLRNMVDIP